MNHKSIAAVGLLMLAAIFGPVNAAKDSGLGHDYRTFHSSGKIEFGNIGDSYTADLVMYLAGYKKRDIKSAGADII